MLRFFIGEDYRLPVLAWAKELEEQMLYLKKKKQMQQIQLEHDYTSFSGAANVSQPPQQDILSFNGAADVSQSQQQDILSVNGAANVSQPPQQTTTNLQTSKQQTQVLVTKPPVKFNTNTDIFNRAFKR